MKRMNLLLVLGLAVPLRAQVAGRVEIAAPLAALPASALAAGTVSPLSSPSLAALPAPMAGPLSSLPAALTPVPGAAPAASPAAGAAREATATERLAALFAHLDALYALPPSSPAAAIRARLRIQLLKAASDYESPEASVLETVARESDRALARVQERLDRGEVDPAARIRVSADEAALPAAARPVRVGVYPVAADPFQWGHLLIALRAVGELGVDKVVFVLAGDDPRKPTMTPAATRHPMGREVLDLFAPFFVYSPIAVGTTLDGETNIFRILALNADRRVEAWYMVGDDHYRVVDKKGNPDTLPKLERNFDADLGHSPTLHRLKVAFIRRELPAEEVPTSLEVRFLDHVGFDASSTLVRGGRHSLMPHAAYEHARRRGLYGLPAADPPDPASGD